MKKAIKELLKLNIKSRKDLMAAKRILAKKYKGKIMLNSEILKEYKSLSARHILKKSSELEKILRKRSVRTLSGIAPVAVLTKYFPCPGKCAYCPHEKNVPPSYLSNEPAVMRAIRCGYNPYVQVQARLKALVANGHEPTKIELIVIGGTWSVLPEKYKFWFIWQCFKAANSLELRIKNYELRITEKNSSHNSLSMIHDSLKVLKNKLLTEQKKNETAKYQIIGITLETRPDYINEKELWEMRELGATRVELGVQAIDDKILKLNKRGHDVATIARATKELKDFGFKVTYHIMPGLPGSTAKKDLAMFKRLFTDARFQPDQIKFYPTVVTRGSLLYKWWRRGLYKSYANKTLEKLIIDCKKVVPPYVRIIRLIRDIPKESIVAGNTITNLRQIMKDRGTECKCIRCREAKGEKFSIFSPEYSGQFSILEYEASEGREYFLSYESKDRKTLFGFCRLRLNSWNTKHETCNMKHVTRNIKHKTRDMEHGANNGNLKFFDGLAIIRELHVYGELVPVKSKNKAIQHVGLGKKLMTKAETIARQNGYHKIAVIAGVGVRGYYKKLGYRLENGYMVKRLDN